MSFMNVLPLTARYLLNCVRFGVIPWRYFYMNEHAFSVEKKLFSKIEIERSIPKKWLLKSFVLDFEKQRTDQLVQHILRHFSFPVFLKPEWGQQSYGVVRIDTAKQLKTMLRKIKVSGIVYFCQQAAPQKTEYDLFFVRNSADPKTSSVFTVTVLEHQEHHPYPVHSVRNKKSIYRDITRKFSSTELKVLQKMMMSLAKLNFARVAVRANSEQDLVKGNFSVIEINMFNPMPINLYDQSITRKEKLAFMDHCSQELVKSIKNFVKMPQQPILRSQIKQHLRVRSKKHRLFFKETS